MKIARLETQKYDSKAEAYVFACPGCEHDHVYVVKSGEKVYVGAPEWSWNGSMESPSFEPSLLNTRSDGKRCHLYLRNGMIEYCGDCTHALAGKSVPCPERTQ